MNRTAAGDSIGVPPRRAFVRKGCWLVLLLCSPGLAQTNNARLLGESIPTTMIPGFRYNVQITMRNTGTTTWTKAQNYYLGAVGDSDPFAPGRIALADGDSIGPGQDRTFSMTMTAPGAGVYTTDWRMLRENVEWFGEALTRQVNVTFGPTPPGVPALLWPTPGMILGSNRPDIRLQGDPSDGYQVRVSPYNSPTFPGGWDSGFVQLNPGADPIMAMVGVLDVQAYYYVFARLHNTNGWGPWTGCGNWFYTAGQLVNEPYYIAGPSGGQWQHTQCYNPDRNEYLVAYMDGTPARSVISCYRLDGTGTRMGGPVSIWDDLEGAGGPHIAYNSARHEYLIAYGGYTSNQGLHDELRLQRMDADTGTLIGTSTRVTNTPGAFNCNVAYSRASDLYLLVWDSGYDSPCPLYATRLDSAAAPIKSVFYVSTAPYVWAGNPAIAFNSVNDEFLVGFQAYYDRQPQTWWDYYAQRVRAGDGALLGSNLTIAASGDSELNGDIAYDSDMNRYLLIVEGGTPTPWCQFISGSGTLMGNRFSIADEYFNGGMAGIAWNPVTKEYLATWAHCCTESNFARRLSQAGERIAEPFRTNGSVRGFGNWDPLPAANTASGEFLIEWFWQYDDVYVRRYKALPLPPPDTVKPAPAAGLALSSTPASITLQWVNPSTRDFSATMIRTQVGSPPMAPNEGVLLGDKGNAPGTADSLVHATPAKGMLVCYSAFAHDLAGNYAEPVSACGMLLAGDFDGDSDVDQEDFGHLQACLVPEGVPCSPGCRDADLDGDGDVDQGDLAGFIPCLGGPGRPPACAD
jgi:hypothetical protein